MESSETSVARAAVMGMPRQRTIWQRVPWLWSDFAARAPVPPWLLSVLLFVLLYGIGALSAQAVGDLPRFLRDLRFLLPIGLPAFASFTLSYAPRTMDRLWANIQPWLANSGEEVAVFQSKTPSLLMRFFWPVTLVLLVFTGSFVSVDMPGNWALDYQNPQVMALAMIFLAPAMAYFLGGAGSVVGIGLALLAYEMGRTLDLKRGFLIQGGKAALQPFNQLIWLGWAFSLPAVTLGIIANTPLITGRPLAPTDILAWVITSPMLFSTLAAPQYFMNRWLAKEKAQELKALQQELMEAASMPETADALEVQRRVLRHQHLVYQIQQVQSFTPTLVDARFVSQIVTSIVVIVLANILIRTVFAGLLL